MSDDDASMPADPFAPEDPFPLWPPDWLEDRSVAHEELLAAQDDVQFRSALGSDGQMMFSVSWPGGRRYMLVDPVGGGVPHALRVGEKSEDPDIGRAVEGVWSGALQLAKQLIDGDVQLPAPEAEEPRRRPWRRGQG